MKPDDVKPSYLLTLIKKLMIKMLSLKLVMFLEYQNMKIFLQMATFQIGLKKVLLLQKKILFRGYMLLVILKTRELVERFVKKNCKKQIKKSLQLQK